MDTDLQADSFAGGDVEEIVVQFDGSQIAIKTDVPEVYTYIAANFSHMVVPTRHQSAEAISVLKRGAGYVVAGQESSQHPFTPLDELLPLLKDAVRINFMRRRPDLLWLHAGAVARDGFALLISGPSGQGKSGLTTRLSEKGWKFLSDDIAPIRLHEDVVIPFPQCPTRRVHPGRLVGSDSVASLQREVIQLDQGCVITTPVRLRALLFVRFQDSSSARLTQLSSGPGAMEVLKNLTNFMDHRHAGVSRAADLARRLDIYELSFERAEDAVATVDALW